MKSSAIFFILLLFGSTMTTQSLSAGQQRRVGNTVARAIEMTKQRQSYDNVVSASGESATSSSVNPTNKPKPNQRPIRTEPLDVARLNQLIKVIDKTWILPRSGSREPVGSNFQYKKTCASIYKSRSGACQQIGFGVMCFNYCFELGEELSFKCQDISEPSYCRSNSNYESFFAKHRKDAYKVKAFIHQTISRCYATAICNSNAILNTTFLNKSSKDLSSAVSVVTRQSSRATTSKAKPGPNGLHQRTSKQSIWDRYAVSSRQETQPPPTPANSGIIGPPASESEFEGQPKYVPFWQRLLKRKNSTASTSATKRLKTTTIESTKVLPEDISAEEDENAKDKGEEIIPDNEETDNIPAAEDEEDEEEMLLASLTTTEAPTTAMKRRRLKPVRLTPKSLSTTTQLPYDIIEEEEANFSPQNKHTWKPLDIKVISTTQHPCRFESRTAAKNDPPGTQSQDASSPEGFWNKFQPGRWFQSLQYITNTG